MRQAFGSLKKDSVKLNKKGIEREVWHEGWVGFLHPGLSSDGHTV